MFSEYLSIEEFDSLQSPTIGDLPVYQGWQNVPNDFLTETGLKKRGKRRTPSQQPVAVVHTQRHRRHHYELLYKIAEAIEFHPYTARQRAALQRVKARVTCSRCGATFIKLSEEGHCSTCQDYLDRRQEARASAVEWAQTIVSQPFLLLDTETTGLHFWDRIVEVAVIDEAGEILLNTLINPEKHIPAEVIAIHGITDDMVRGQPTFHEILPDLEAIFTDKPIVVYNVGFDKPFLARAGLKVENYNFQCAMLMYAKFFGSWSDYYKNWKRQSLQAACSYCNIQWKNMHRAAADCEATRQVVFAMARERHHDGRIRY
jgi:DNA polymerase III subunit epsilon